MLVVADVPPPSDGTENGVKLRCAAPETAEPPPPVELDFLASV